MTFSDDEATFLRSEDLPYMLRTASIATVTADGQPDVVAVGYEFDGTYIYVGGARVLKTRKYRNVLAGNTRVAFFIERKADEEPWAPAWLRIYGTADLVQREGTFAAAGQQDYIRITPVVSWSFNLQRANVPPGSSHEEGLEFFARHRIVRNVHDAVEAKKL
ncbi:PPOX class F420-dependent oxidoreductase [Streptomyces sp. NPDC057257]|uniref:PPOX class F420-dependent oxidoreductase n=1 Tax=Streptomyces sp. NPDC057257 TaxID=3346071 RepID=UPI00362E60DE